MYFGSAKRLQERDEDGLSKSESSVIRILNGLLDRGAHVYTVNFYNSSRLIDFLWDKHTYLTGIINPKRGVPKILQNFQIDVKGSVFIRNGYKLICKSSDR